MKTRTALVVLAVALLLYTFVGQAFSQEIPAPGTTIDKSNYKEYMHLFPPEFADLFETGIRGLVPPVKMAIQATTPSPVTPKYVQFSARNKGKYSIGPDGDITPRFDREGMPFPDLQKGDKDFAQKVMWNCDNRYRGDQTVDPTATNYTKRHGEKTRIPQAEIAEVYFIQRQFLNPVPDLPNPVGLRSAGLFNFQLPDNIKNTMLLAYRYVAREKPDETYLYLPALRRALRAEATQRSVPINSDIDSLDDQAGFNGNVYEWSFTLVGEGKVVAGMDITSFTFEKARAIAKTGDMPFPNEGYQIKDAYIIDAKAKNPKYPMSRKRLWIDKTSYHPLYSISYDKPGKLWKLSTIMFKTHKMADGSPQMIVSGMFTADVQFGIVKWAPLNFKVNGQGSPPLNYNDLTPASLLSKAR